MPHSAKKINTYAKKIDELKNAAVKLPNETRLAINAATETHRIKIKDLIERRIVDGQIATGETISLQEAIRTEVNAMIADAKAVLAEEQAAAFELATTKAREIALEAGGTFFAPSSNLLVVTQHFSADLITGLADEAMRQVNGILSKTALGALNPYEAMKEVDAVIGVKGGMGVSYKAESIVRTEVHRIYSAALDAQFESFLQTGVDRKKVKKRWVSGPYRTGRREDHQEMNGVEVPYDEPFKMPSGNLLMFPGDSGGPPEDVINCGCTWILAPESIEEAVLDAIEVL